MNCSIEELFPNFPPDTSTDLILKKLKHTHSQLNRLRTPLTLTQSQASLVVSNLSSLIRENETHKDILIVSFLLIQKILNYISESTQQFLANFILVSTHFGFERTEALSSTATTPTLQLSSPITSNLFIKFIFLREFITGKDTTILKFLFYPSFEKSVIYQFFFTQLLILSNDENFPIYIRVFFHTLIQWLDTALLFFKHIPYDPNINNDVFRYEQPISKFIFKFVWRFIEEPLSGISENARIILQKYIRIYTKFCSWSNQDPTPFLQCIIHRTLLIPWTSKARYILLHVMTEHVPSHGVISTHRHLPCELSRCLSTTSLYNPASDLYRALITGISIQEWEELWLVPFMSSLLSLDQDERHHLTQYWLPSTLKLIPKSSERILTSIIYLANLTNSSHARFLTHLHTGDMDTCIINLTPNNNSILYAIVLWLKYSISLDLFRLTGAYGGILSEGLRCGDEFVRIEAMHVILTSGFERSQLWRLALIREFIPQNLNPSSTPSRQKLSVIMHRSVTQIQNLLIDGLPSDLSPDSVDSFKLEYTSFIRILCLLRSKSLLCLWPDSPFQKVTLGLSIYQSLVDSFVSHIETRKSNSKSRESKLRLYNLLCDLDFELLTLSDLVPVCLCLTSDYFEIRESALNIIVQHLTMDSVSQALRSVFPDGLSARGRSLLASSRVYDGETGAMLLKLNLKCEISNFKDTPVAIQLYRLCLALLTELSKQFASARNDILEAAHHAPLFSTITAIISALNVDLPIKEQEGIDWQKFLSDLIALLNDIIKFCLSTLGDSSRTDNEDVLAPSFADMGVSIESAVLATQSSENAANSHTDCSSVSYQFVLNCVWLTLRESNTLMGALSSLPIANSAQVRNSMLLLTPQLVDKIGSILITILTKCRHVGALLSGQAALIKFCSNISYSAIPSVSGLPSKWLHEIISTITSHDKKSSISRQGAGLPLCVQSILTSESKHPHKPLLSHAMHTLFIHARNTELDGTNGTLDLVSVRCTNVLRALFRDSSVGNECVLSYGEKGLALAVSSMRSPVWSVRNAGMMLFGALAVKMLGQRRLSEESSELNCITIKQFFTRFPSARSLLLSQLQSSPDCASTNLHAAVFPVLLLLSKLCPSPHYAFPEKLDYMRTLQCYAHSPVHSVRCKASQALATVLYTRNMDTVTLRLLNNIPSSFNARSISYNVLHGQLVLISELLKAAYATYGNGCTDYLPDVFKRVMGIRWLLGKDVPLLINKVYFSVVRTLIDCGLGNNTGFELNCDIFDTLAQHSYTDPCIIDFIISILEYFQYSLQQTTEDFQRTFYKFITEFLHKIMNYPTPTILHFNTSLLKYPNLIHWLATHINSVFLDLLNCFIELKTTQFGSLTSLVETITQMLEIMEFDESIILGMDSLVETLLVEDSDITLQLCSMQICSILLIRKLVIKREDEVKMFCRDLVRKHSKPDSSEDSRMACVAALVRFFTPLPVSEYTNTVLTECVDVVILLLQDELAEVRNAMANGLANVSGVTPPLHPHPALKLLFNYISTNWYRLKPVWNMLCGFITAKITMNDTMVINDEVVLFERGKDNIFGEDCVNVEFALRSLCIISTKLENPELKEYFIQSMHEHLEKELQFLPEITEPNALDSLFRRDALLFKKISGVLCLSRLLSRLGTGVPESENILKLSALSFMCSLTLKQIEEWMQEI